MVSSLRSPAVVIACLLGLTISHGQADTFQWKTTVMPANGTWSTPTNWVGNAAPTGANTTDLLIFDGDVGTAVTATNYTTTNDLATVPFVLNRITLQATDNAGLPDDPTHLIAGNQLRLDGTTPQITQSGAGSVTFNAPLFLPKNLTLNGTGTGAVTFNRGLGGFADLIKNGTSTFRFGTFPVLPATKAPSENTWVGTLQLNDGTFRFNNNADSGRTALRANPVAFPASMPGSGLTPTLACSSELRSGSLSGTVGLVESAVVSLDTDSQDIVITALSDADFGGTIHLGSPTGTGNDTGRLVIRGPGVQTLRGTLLIDKDVSVGGSLTLTGDYSLGGQSKGAINLAGGGVFLDNTSGNSLDFAGRLRDASSSSTSVDVAGGGSLTLIGATGGTTETVGRLQLSALTGTSPSLKTKARSGHLALGLTHRAASSAATELNFAFLNRDATTTPPLNTVEFSAVNGSGTALDLGTAGNNPRIRFSIAPTLSNSLLSNSSGTTNVGWATTKTTTGLAFATHDLSAVNGISPATTTGTWASSATANVLLSTSQSIGTSTFALNSLRILPSTTGQTLNIANGATFSTNGIILAGNTDFTISGVGTAALGGTSPRFFHVENAVLTLSAKVGNTAPLVKAGAGTLLLTNTTNASSQQVFAINQGSVRTTSAPTLPGGEIRFRGGVLELGSGGTFSRPLVNSTGISATGTVNWSTVELAGSPIPVPTGVVDDRGSGGFAAIGSDVSIDLGAAGVSNLLWEQSGFVQSGYALVLGSRSATAKVTLTDNLSLSSGETNINYNAREIRVDDNTGSAADRAILSGVVSGTIYNDLLKTGAGVLQLNGVNTFQGMAYIQSGTLIVSGSTNNAIGIEIFNGATLAGNGSVTTLLLDSGGKIAPGDGSIATLTGTSLDWKAGGTCLFDLGTSSGSNDRIALGSGALMKNGTGTFTFDFGGTGSFNRTYTLATFGSTNFIAGDFTAANLPANMSGSFSVTATTLTFTTLPSEEPMLEPTTIASNNPTAGWAKQGDTVTISFTATETIQTPSATIAGQAATVANPSGNNWTASIIVGAAPPQGPATFSISCSDLQGHAGAVVTATTDASSVIIDTTAPQLTLPANKTVEAISAAGATTTYVPTATDALGTAQVASLPTSGSLFALGTTAVNVSATDTAGNIGTGSFDVTVQDTTAPALTVPANITVTAPDANGLAVDFTPTATDAVSTPVIQSNPASGTIFLYGVTTVNVTATDAANNVASGSFTVTVHDTNPPVLTVPANLTVWAPNSSGALVSFTPTATDAEGEAVIESIPGSGTVFPVGDTTVSVTATDNSGNTDTGTFTVTVKTIAAGAYNGLAVPTVAATSAADQVGSVTLSVLKTGAFTGKLILGGSSKAIPISGTVGNNGNLRFGKTNASSFSIVRTGKTTLDLALSLDLTVAPQIGQLTGTLKEGAVTVANLSADRAVFTSKANPVSPLVNVPLAVLDPATDKGKYTVLLQARTPVAQGQAASAFPQGDGWALTTVAKTGVVKAVGKLADGTAFTCSKPLSVNREWPFYVALYKGTGSISGVVSFRDSPSLSDVDGADLRWFKPINLKDKVYRDGWPTGIFTDLIGSKYVPPTAASGFSALLVDGETLPSTTQNATLAVSDGLLPTTGSANISVSDKSKVTLLGTTDTFAEVTTLKCTIKPTTGAVSGSFKHPISQKTTPFTGVIIQKQHFGSGYFLGAPAAGSFTTPESGAFDLEPLP